MPTAIMHRLGVALAVASSLVFVAVPLRASEGESPSSPNRENADPSDFPTTYDQAIDVLARYYGEGRPLDFFFEMYVVDVIEQLPQGTVDALAELSAKHPTLFRSYGGSWRDYVVGESHLSKTFEFAVWDLWIKLSRKAHSEGRDYDPWLYARDFKDNYFAPGSRVDVWEGGSLEQAKARIRAYRRAEGKSR